MPYQTGFILHVTEYPACVAFYRDVLELPVTSSKDGLTAFAFGASYLLVEEADEAWECERPLTERMCLRLDVADERAFAAEVDRLRGLGVEVGVEDFEWGTVAMFTDPAGTPCEYKLPRGRPTDVLRDV